MQETILLSISLHIFVISITLILALYLLFNAFFEKDFIKFYNRQKFLYTQFNILIGAIFFTGIIVMAMNQFNFRPAVWIMIIAFLIMVFMTIKLKFARYHLKKNDLNSYNNFRNFVKKKYLLDILLLGLQIVSKNF